MKYTIKSAMFALLLTGLMAAGWSQAQAQITVKVDSTKSWASYVNRYDTNNNYQSGGAVAMADLRAAFVPSKADATRIVLRINTNTYNPADPAWNLPDGTPTKHLESNFYVDVGTGFAGNDVTFVGTVESNSLPEGWTCEAVIKEFASGYAYIGDTRQALVTGEPFNITRTIPAGHICQYGFLLFGPNTAPDSDAAKQGVSIVVDNADPAITADPVDQRVGIGGTASFTVAATGSSTLSYQWNKGGVPLSNLAGKIYGATSSTLVISNAQPADATNYNVTVTDTASSVNSQSARLRVLSPADLANLLNNPSFEEDVIAFQTVPDPWVNFTGSALLSGPEFIFGTPYDGTNVVQVYNAGQYNGIYQDVHAQPGQIFTGDCWIFQSTFDALTAPIDEAYLEVQFWGVTGGGPIAMYHSILITNDPTMLDTWLHLEATNGVAAGYAATSTSNANYLVAPAGTDHVRFQITLHYEGGGSGSVFVDAMRLLQKMPVTVNVGANNGNITLSWPTALLNNYQVVYKDNLSDPGWTPIGDVIPGDGTVKSAVFATTNGKRFYSVLTQ